MSQILVVVALGKITPLVGAARFLAIQRAMHDGLGDVEHEAKFERRGELGIEGPRVVVHREIAIALAQLAQLVGGFDQRIALAINSAAGLHRMRHLVAQLGDALGAAGLMEKLLFEATLFIGGLCQ